MDQTLHSDPVVPVLLGLVCILAGAKLGAYLARQCKQPPVLGELLAGVVLGNFALIGVDVFEFIKNDSIYQVFAGIGVILLLFEVGLESDLRELLSVGLSATLVAVVGVVLPMVLGWGVARWLLPEHSVYSHVFVGTTLCATSVGITARVLKDLKKIHIPEAKIILGAAVIDDVLGLIILAVITGIIGAAASQVEGQQGFDFAQVGWIAFKAVAFLVVALVIGMRASRWLFRLGALMQVEGMLQTLALITCFVLAYLSHVAGLAPIVGAFAAGLIIDSTGIERRYQKEELPLEESLLPISRFFVPVFFVTMGMKVDVKSFFDGKVLIMALFITAAAVIGKQACSLAARERGLNRWAIGIGMVPRGEVGLIFASIGATLTLGKEQIVDTTLLSALILMVVLTTLITPPALKWVLRRS